MEQDRYSSQQVAERRSGKDPVMKDEPVDISEAIVLYLKHYPGKNQDEFLSRVDDEPTRVAVRAMLDETIRTRIDWDEKTLIEIGEEVQSVMRERHPELSDAALRKLGNYFTYLVK